MHDRYKFQQHLAIPPFLAARRKLRPAAQSTFAHSPLQAPCPEDEIDAASDLGVDVTEAMLVDAECAAG